MFKYASNVAKSVGFISVNVIKGLNPTLSKEKVVELKNSSPIRHL